MRPEPSRRSRLLAAAGTLPARVAITLILLAALATQLDWGTALTRVQDGSPVWLVAGVGVLLMSLLVGAWRWGLLLRGADVPADARAVVRGYFMGAFANNFLPTGFGGDAVRALAVARPGRMLARAATTVIMDRLSALAILVALGWFTVAVDADAVPAEAVAGLAAISGAGLFGAVLVSLAARSRRLRQLVPARLRSVAAEMARPLAGLGSDRPLIVSVVALGLLYQALTVLSVWCAARTIGLDVAYALVAVSVPVVLVLTLLPVSLAGFGVREGGYAVLLGTAGVSVTDATLLSLLTVLTMALASLPGAVAILTGSRGSRAAHREA